MNNLDPAIRNASRAVIFRGAEILLLRKEGINGGERFALPGGGQDVDETLEASLQRECLEEIGTEVGVIDLVRVADFYKQRDTDPPSTRHLVEFLFRCTVPDDYVPHNGHHPDKHQIDVVWMPVAELDRHVLFPPSLSAILQAIEAPVAGTGPCYLGTI